MPEKRWVTSAEAARLMSENNGRPISAAYVRLLGRRGVIKVRPLDDRTNLYSAADSAHQIVKEKPKTRAPRKQRATGNPPGRPRKERTTEKDEHQILDLVG